MIASTVPVTEFTIDAAADKIVDLAMTAAAYPPMTREQRDQLRCNVQDAVDALIDQCRAYYREEPSDHCPACQVAGSQPVIPHGSADAFCSSCGADWPSSDDETDEDQAVQP